MSAYRLFKELYKSTYVAREDAEEPYRTHLQKWLNVGKLSMLSLGVSLGSTITKELPIKYFDGGIDKVLSATSIGGIALAVALDVAMLTGVGVTEARIEKAKSIEN